MSEKLLPLSLANPESRFARRARLVAIGVGLLAVLWGTADITSRLAHAALGNNAGATIFGPAAATDPALLNALKGTEASATTTAPFVPARLKVPSVGIDANVEQVGQKQDGTMATPTDFADVGWYALGGHPGGAGNAVMAGHVNNALTKSGVFGHLGQVHLGDYITVSDAAGKTLVYKVRAIDEYPANQAPAQSIFAATGPSQLILITCDGDWVQSEKTFDKRLVITAIPAY